MSPLPPFPAIEAFVVAARLQSLTAAAAALSISVPALSRRIKVLEEVLGLRLLRREARGVSLTPSGSRYFAEVHDAVDRLHAATDALRDRDRGASRRVRISLISTLAVNWLAPRLPRFHASHPDIALDLHTSPDCVDLDAHGLDLAIRLGEGGWPGLRIEPLIGLEIYPVCSPALRGRIAPDLAGQPLLGPDHRPEFWPEWARGAQVDVDGLARVRTFDNLQLLHEAATHGLGVAIALDPLVRPYLADGRLVQAVPTRVRSSRSFHLVSRHATRRGRAVEAVRAWLHAEAASGLH